MNRRLSADQAWLSEAGRIWLRLCEDLKTDGDKARTRALAGIQIAMREAYNAGRTDGRLEADLRSSTPE